MLVTHLDENGKIKQQERTRAFFDTNADPVFAKPAVIAGVYYFPSFKGMVQPVDMTGANPGISANLVVTAGTGQAGELAPRRLANCYGP